LKNSCLSASIRQDKDNNKKLYVGTILWKKLLLRLQLR
jgi:hypothetical protein